ncbi:bile acid:sodium symporter [Methylocystis sp. 9N]|uniref:Bile acid:sodium symporter n=1 Tax=Methylocystis borbori TaxID=3118750 RepID=A0ABU7XI23_9HYPH
MSDQQGAVAKMAHIVHRYFIWIVIASYIGAAAAPRAGALLHQTHSANIGSSDLHGSAAMALLALLLFNAGLFTNLREARSVVKRPFLVVSGVLGNFVMPYAFVAAASLCLKPWHNPDEAQQILTGLAFVAAMPIAGSSTAWTQSANGNLSLSIGLVLATTLLSPLVTPLVIHGVGALTTGDYSEDLHELAAGNAVNFLGAWVVAPSLLGVLAARVIPQPRIMAAKPFVKLVNYAMIAALTYANAALSLPAVVSDPDGDFLALMLAIVVALCVVAFTVGYVCARFGRAGRGETASLMFGLGMANNGAGLTLASTAMADHAGVMLPAILYNLVQHFAAAIVDRMMFQKAADPA